MDTQSFSDASSPPSPSLSVSTLSVAATADTAPSDFGDDSSLTSPNAAVEDASYILVIGGLGYIGSHTVLELLKEGYNVVIVDDLSNSFSSVFDRINFLAAEHCQATGQRLPSLKLHCMDYRSPSLRSLLWRYRTRPNANPSDSRRSMIHGVIHFAAFKSVSESIARPLDYYQNNVGGFIDLLSTLKEFGIDGFVFSSSATVYGSVANRGIPLREEDCVHQTETYTDASGAERRTENGVRGLTSPYGRTKWMCEAILADLAASDPSWSIAALRYFNPVGCHSSGLLGEDSRQTPTNLFPIISRVLTGVKPTLDVFGTDWATSDGTAVRDFIHVVDLARGHVSALAAVAARKLASPFRTFNLGTGHGHTVQEVVDSMEHAAKRSIPVRHEGRRAGDVGSCVADVQRATSELDWRAQKSLQDCAESTWAYVSK
ncbi:hypothetical protein LTR50_006857 [Elasticomyces elasticus]|nr:hypothetical protein LTR50_006857 [Elasticomyces elasticus]